MYDVDNFENLFVSDAAFQEELPLFCVVDSSGLAEKSQHRQHRAQQGRHGQGGCAGFAALSALVALGQDGLGEAAAMRGPLPPLPPPAGSGRDGRKRRRSRDGASGVEVDTGGFSSAEQLEAAEADDASDHGGGDELEFESDFDSDNELEMAISQNQDLEAALEEVLREELVDEQELRDVEDVAAEVAVKSLLPQPQEAPPSSSSSSSRIVAADVADVAVVASHIPAANLAAAFAAAAAAPRSAPQHRTPIEVIAALCPPSCSVYLGSNAFRWRVHYPVSDDSLSSDLNRHHCTRAFGAKRSWQEALAESHQWMWQKWQELPQALQGSISEGQAPGFIDAATLQAIEPFIAAMPEERKKYGKRAAPS